MCTKMGRGVLHLWLKAASEVNLTLSQMHSRGADIQSHEASKWHIVSKIADESWSGNSWPFWVPPENIQYAFNGLKLGAGNMDFRNNQCAFNSLKLGAGNMDFWKKVSKSGRVALELHLITHPNQNSQILERGAVSGVIEAVWALCPG